jgi:hypothetical protein
VAFFIATCAGMVVISPLLLWYAVQEHREKIRLGKTQW